MAGKFFDEWQIGERIAHEMLNQRVDAVCRCLRSALILKRPS